jgi:hypothetical protein
LIDTITNESPETTRARRELKRILLAQDYIVEEEVPLEDVTNNMGEEIYPPYRADLLVTKKFIIELDPQSSKKYKSKGHGTKRRRIHDQWRDRNVISQTKLKTVRLKPEDILNYDESLTLHEIDSQLRHQD